MTEQELKTRRRHWRELRRQASAYARRHRLTPPLSLAELQSHVDLLLLEDDEKEKGPPEDVRVLAVLLNNEAWSETLAAIPFHRRLLLLPRCLSERATCPAAVDELGLLCESCGGCAIGDLLSLAEELGYVVLVAEGTTAVTALLQDGSVDAVVGASCLEALAESFPVLLDDAVPGLALPLLNDGCNHTGVDDEWLKEMISLQTPGESFDARLPIDELRREVAGWFNSTQLSRLIGDDAGEVGRLAVDWLLRAGKRWRPFLVTACHDALLAEAASCRSEALKHLAIATECLHKASLIHDDIEDGDEVRYAAPALHCEQGTAVALNVGDFLIGEGYRLIATAGAGPQLTCRMLSMVAENHRWLCRGQGAELECLRRAGGGPGVAETLEIFRYKTAPAFDVALQLGALLAGADEGTRQILSQYSQALGIAYQIKDDLADFEADAANGPQAGHQRLSVISALLHEQAGTQSGGGLPAAWAAANELLEKYCGQARNALNGLDNAALKILLVRVLRRMLPTT